MVYSHSKIRLVLLESSKTQLWIRIRHDANRSTSMHKLVGYGFGFCRIRILTVLVSLLCGLLLLTWVTRTGTNRSRAVSPLPSIGSRNQVSLSLSLSPNSFPLSPRCLLVELISVSIRRNRRSSPLFLISWRSLSCFGVDFGLSSSESTSIWVVLGSQGGSDSDWG